METKPFEIQEAMAHPERVVHLHIPEWVAESVSIDPDDKVTPVRVEWSGTDYNRLYTGFYTEQGGFDHCFYTKHGRFAPEDGIPRIALKVVDHHHAALKVVGHRHAALMKQYAEDAETHERPWELWWYKDVTISETWTLCWHHPGWFLTREYRRTEDQLEIKHGKEYEVAGGVALCISFGANLPNGMSCVLLATDSDGNQYVAETDSRGRLKDGEQFVVRELLVVKQLEPLTETETPPAIGH